MIYVMKGRHGYGAYSNGCRCTTCREAKRRYGLAWRKLNLATGLAPDDSRHGSNTAYVNNLCRCNRCLAAHREFQRVGDRDE